MDNLQRHVMKINCLLLEIVFPLHIFRLEKEFYSNNFVGFAGNIQHLRGPLLYLIIQ